MALVFLASSIALSSPSTTGKGFGVAPASKPTINKATASSAPSRPAVADFEKWAVDNGIKKIEKIDVGEFNGERGVVASAEIAAGARVLSVPSSLTLQVNSLSKCPRWCEEETWRTAKWDARLAMMLLHEEADKRSSLKPWLAQLPRDFSTPVLWSQPTQPFEAMGYQALSSSIMRQADEWEASRQRAPGSPSAEQWTWAMNVVRSRAFSGPYAPGTFIGALLQLFGASTLALGYAVSCGSRLPPQAAIGRLAVAQTPRRASHDTVRTRRAGHHRRRWRSRPGVQFLPTLRRLRALQRLPFWATADDGEAIRPLPMDRLLQPRRHAGSVGSGVRVRRFHPLQAPCSCPLPARPKSRPADERVLGLPADQQSSALVVVPAYC